MMFGLLLGTVCLFLLMMMSVRARRRWAYARDMAGGCGDHRGHRHGPPWMRHHRGHRGPDREDDEPHEERRGRGRRGPGRRGRRGRVAWLRSEAARRLNLDDHQRDVIEVAAKQADKAMKDFVDIVADSRDELGDAVKGEQLDQARLDAVFEKWDESMAEARKELVDALRRAHAALEPEQRRRLSEWINLAGGER